MKLIYTLLLLLLTPLTCKCQTYRLKNYLTYSANDKETYFTDGFNDNHNNWLDSIDNHAEIRNSYFQIYNIDSVMYYIDKPIDAERDFEIEFSAKIEGKHANKLYARFAWGNDCYTFGSFLSFSKNYIDCFNCQYGNCDTTLGTYIFNTHKNDFNLYTIRKIDSFYYIFVNQKFVQTYPYRKLAMNNIMISGHGQARVTFDTLSISYLKTPTPDNLNPIFLKGKSALNNFIKSNIRITERMKDECLNTRFFVSVLVNSNGIVDSVISYSINHRLNEAIVQTLKYSTGLWAPAYSNGRPAAAWYTAPVNFTSATGGNCLPDIYYYTRGESAFNNNDQKFIIENTEKALNYFINAARVNYFNIQAWYNIVIIYTRQQKVDKALEYLNLMEIAASLKTELTLQETKIIKDIPSLRKTLLQE